MLRLLTVLNFVLLSFPVWAADAGALSASCQAFVKKLPPQYQWDTVDVPQDWDLKNGPRVPIFYYWNAQATGEPILFLNGGPVASSWNSFEHLRYTGKTDLPLVFMDQRGTGCSVERPKGDFHVKDWASSAIARDAEALRLKLLGGKKKWKLLGHSYGMRIALRYFTYYPNAVISIHTYGNTLVDDSIGFLVDKMRGQNRVLTNSYLKLYPGDERILRELRSQAQNSCTEVSGKKVCGATQLDALGLYLPRQMAWEELHLWVEALGSQYWTPTGEPMPVRLDSSALSNLIRENVRWRPDTADLFYSAIYAYEITPDYAPNRGCLAALKERGAGDDLINECRFWTTLAQGEVDPRFEVTPDPVTISQVYRVLRAHPEVRWNAFAAENDFRIPVETFAPMNAALGHLPNFHYELRYGADHEGYAVDALLWRGL